MPNSRKEYHAQRWKDKCDEMKPRQADWRKENRAKKKAYDKKYREEHREKINEYQKEYIKNKRAAIKQNKDKDVK